MVPPKKLFVIQNRSGAYGVRTADRFTVAEMERYLKTGRLHALLAKWGLKKMRGETYSMNEFKRIMSRWFAHRGESVLRQKAVASGQGE